MNQVTKEEFYTSINPTDSLVSIVSDSYPYTYEFRLRNNRKLTGKIVDSYSENGKYPIISSYFLPVN